MGMIMAELRSESKADSVVAHSAVGQMSMFVCEQCPLSPADKMSNHIFFSGGGQIPKVRRDTWQLIPLSSL